MENYELFNDESYYNLFCVRNINDKRFESSTSFHFEKYEDAVEFKRLIEIAK